MPGGLLRVHAQNETECGGIDTISYPLDLSDTFARAFDDFARYRRRFGGLHTGIDLAFNRTGEPVHASANGRVTYANPEGWDTEKGVVILRHVFPDGGVYYSVYGHMEESAEVRFPPVGACVERGDVIGLVGDPSLSAPHLHYEIRNFMPDDGGPGYVQTNPRLQGWFHPLDFTTLWRIRLQPGFLSSATLDAAPDLPPVVLDSGVIAAATSATVSALRMPDERLWQITSGAELLGLVALPGNRLAAVTREGAVSIFENSRYAARWSVDGASIAPVALGDALIFVLDEALVAFDAAGNVLWRSLGLYESADQVMGLTAHGATLALTVRNAGRYRWLLVDTSGRQLLARDLSRQPVAAPGPLGSWLLLDGTDLLRIDGGESRSVGTTGQSHGRYAAMTVDQTGNIYLYLGDSRNTLMALGPTGELRWQVTYPARNASHPPLMATGSGCTLYTLDSGGVLSLFDAASGALAEQLTLYAGGEDTARPNARLLTADASERLLVGAGFQSILLLNGAALAPASAAACLPG